MSVTVDRHGAVAVVCIDRPTHRNALGPAQGAELRDVLLHVGADEAVSAVVLTGNGAFCAGGDLPAIVEVVTQGPAAVRDLLYETFHGLVRAVVGLPVPVLAAVDGAAVGLGMDMALACDWRAVGARGWLRQGWADLGVIPGTGGELLLRRLAPTLVWSLLGRREPVGPDECVRLGIADVAVDEALPAARLRADELVGVDRHALTGYVSLHRAGLRADLDAHLERCLELQVDLLCSGAFLARAERALARG